jgi:hypothetical protein
LGTYKDSSNSSDNPVSRYVEWYVEWYEGDVDVFCDEGEPRMNGRWRSRQGPKVVSWYLPASLKI